MKNHKNPNSKEDTTAFGEFISSFHHWLSPEKQREKASELEKAGKDEEN